MPISSWSNITPIINEVYRLQPKTVCDLGVGWGKWGTLCREALDAMHGRCRPDQWETTIVGVEAHEPYRNPIWGAYDRVDIGNFAEMIPVCCDLVLMIDSLEHLEPEQGRDFLAKVVANNRNVIVSVPVQHMPQGAVYGNEFETHRTHHQGHEFNGYEHTVLHRDMCLTVSIRGRLA